MKKTMLLVVMIMSSQSFLFPHEKLSFEKVIQVDSASKETIYNGMKEWFGMNFVSAKNVLQIDDKDAGLIIANALTSYSYGKLRYVAYDGSINYTIKIQIKDSRFKFEITNINHKSHSGTHADYWSLGMLTDSEEYPGKCSGMEKSYFNKVWINLKIKSEILAKSLLLEIENIKFNSISIDTKNADW